MMPAVEIYFLGVVVGAYRSESYGFKYGMVDIRYFQSPVFVEKSI